MWFGVHEVPQKWTYAEYFIEAFFDDSSSKIYRCLLEKGASKRRMKQEIKEIMHFIKIDSNNEKKISRIEQTGWLVGDLKNNKSVYHTITIAGGDFMKSRHEGVSETYDESLFIERRSSWMKKLFLVKD